MLIRPPIEVPTERVKGAATPQLFLVAGADPTLVTGAVSPNSALRLRFDPQGKRFARVLWAGPDGALSDLHPLAPEPPLSMGAAAGPRWLDHQLTLDAEPRDEALLIVLCDTPIGHAEAIQRVSAPGDCAIARVPVKKRR